MNDIRSKIVGLIVGFGLLAILGYGCLLLLAEFVGYLGRINPTTAAAIIGFMATTLVGGGGVIFTQLYAKKRDAEEAHRERKAAIYKEFLEIVARFGAAENPSLDIKPPSQKELQEFFLRLKTDLVLWASPEVIDAQLLWTREAARGGNPLLAVDRLYLAIRKDLGLSNWGLNKHQLIRMQLKDPDELDTRPLPRR